MWNPSSLWFEVTFVSTMVALGHVCLGHFEVKSSRFRKFLKYLFTLVLVVGISALFGRRVALTVYGFLFLPVLYIHLIDLPRKGVNGWTAEPRAHYYELRGWTQDEG